MFNSEEEFNSYYNNNYHEPWLSTVMSSDGAIINYNKSEYQQLLETPLTFEILSDGEIKWTAQNSSYTCTIEYKKNDGQWISITSNTGTSAPSINVVSGDIVQFRGDNATYASDSNKYNSFNGTTCQFNVNGNIMSLINSTNFTNITTFTNNYTFCELFNNYTGLISAKNLILPVTILSESCYFGMFFFVVH